MRFFAEATNALLAELQEPRCKICIVEHQPGRQEVVKAIVDDIFRLLDTNWPEEKEVVQSTIICALTYALHDIFLEFIKDDDRKSAVDFTRHIYGMLSVQLGLIVKGDHYPANIPTAGSA